MTIQQAFDLYVDGVLREKNRSLRTEDNYFQALKSLQKVVKNKDINAITHKDVRKWSASMKDQGCTPGTMRGYKSKLKNVLKYTNKKRLTCFDLDDIALDKLPKRLPEYITPDEVRRMIACCKTLREELIISLLFSVGLRVSELSDANRRDIRDNTFNVAHGKGDKERQVPISDKNIDRINRYLETREDKLQPLIMGKKGRLSTHQIQKIIKDIKRRAGIDRPVSPRILRHSFATDLHANGAEITYVQKFLGHAHISTTMIYTHILDEKAKGVMAEYQTAV